MSEQIKKELNDLEGAPSIFKKEGRKFRHAYGIRQQGTKEEKIITNILHSEMRYLVCYVFWKIESWVSEEEQAYHIANIINSSFPYEKEYKKIGIPELNNVINDLVKSFEPFRSRIENLSVLKENEILNKNIENITGAC
ncbi:hypothetical protein [Bacillus altitudinis]|uniref:hypothetical protein n=1 Tax=Bacillus altitudinis TaxID=293387 RepID=UPI001F602846|nr:hypothetical protein [Bacillus altitudinis]